MQRKYIRFVKGSFIWALLVIFLYAYYQNTLDTFHNQVPEGEIRAVSRFIYSSYSLLASRTMFADRVDNITFTKEDMIDEHGKPYTIIIWSRRSRKPGYQANPLECLGNISCNITYESNLLDRAHAVVFNSGDISKLIMPERRKSEQYFVWWASESPARLRAEHKHNFFNLTFHYRTDADIYAPYGSINLILRELTKSGETDLNALLETKRKANKTVAWAVSNCYKARMTYARSLMDAGLDVHTYGRCFGRRQIGNGPYSASFYKELSEYKFYFSFENCIHCKDYFTEKFWFNGLRSGAVPIVWGPKKSDLLKVAPTESFIHIEDFNSTEALVRYIQYLARNETAYAEYLQWRTWIKHPERIEERLLMRNRDNDLRSFCKLCSIIQTDGRKRKLGLKPSQRVVKSLKQAWHGAEMGECHH